MKNDNNSVFVTVKSSFIPTAYDFIDTLKNPEDSENANIERYSETSIVVDYQEIDKITPKNIVVHGNRIDKSKLNVLDDSEQGSVRMLAVVSANPEDYSESQDQINAMINLVSKEVERKIDEERVYLLEALTDAHQVLKRKTSRVKTLNKDLFIKSDD